MTFYVAGYVPYLYSLCVFDRLESLRHSSNCPPRHAKLTTSGNRHLSEILSGIVHIHHKGFDKIPDASESKTFPP